MNNNIIVFTDTVGLPEEFQPKPASKVIPEWYKNMDSYLNDKKEPNGNAQTNATIKRCMPVFDAIISGYIIQTPVDIWVKQNQHPPKEIRLTDSFDEISSKTQPFYEWSNLDMISFHPIEQAPTHPNNNGHSESYPKLMNPWSIKTPPGYSCLFVQPFHRESPFTIFPGIVDTDTYDAPVQFPFVLNKPSDFSGLIPAGTPMAQVIPFKRESWQMQAGNQDNITSQAKTTMRLKSKFFDSYKNQFRQSKEYR